VLNNSQKLLKKGKAENETLEDTIAYLKSERDILRNEVGNIFGLSEGQDNAANSTGSERECDAGNFKALVKACKVTTLDFNACRAAFDANCELTGCE
jgi:hypothetical protein